MRPMVMANEQCAQQLLDTTPPEDATDPLIE